MRIYKLEKPAAANGGPEHMNPGLTQINSSDTMSAGLGTETATIEGFNEDGANTAKNQVAPAPE